MFLLLLIVIAVLFGLGFLNPIWWVAGAVLVYGATRHARDRGGGRTHDGGADLGDYRDYRDYRDRRERWDRRYSRHNRARRRREDRRDHEHHE
ncbi:hypothetical protein OG381_45290 [Streptomyces sp. NBC_00490]|uniref:hypothetical protein n=1 Tax=Streptomyces sp. NBC_00490 TaxID=2903657 RepID=UPI002E18C2DC